MDFSNRRYATVDKARFMQAITEGNVIPEVFFDNVMQSASIENLRTSLDGSMFVIKSENSDHITFLRMKADELGIPYQEYDYNQMLELMASETWTKQGEPEIT